MLLLKKPSVFFPIGAKLKLFQRGLLAPSFSLLLLWSQLFSCISLLRDGWCASVVVSVTEFVICKSRAYFSSHPCVELKYSATELSILSCLSFAISAEEPRGELAAALPREAPSAGTSLREWLV